MSGVFVFGPFEKFFQRGCEGRYSFRLLDADFTLCQLDAVGGFNFASCLPAARLCRLSNPPTLEYEFKPILRAAFVNCDVVFPPLVVR